MRREDLEHIIRASSDITKQYEFIIVGSQSILGAVPNPPVELTASIEADIYPRDKPELADEIDGAIGEGSAFHEQNGYYAQGVGIDTAVLPSDWMDRVHKIQNANTNLKVGWCIDPIDLFLAKTAANRPGGQDREFCFAMLERKFVSQSQALALVALMPLDQAQQKTLRATINRWVRELQAEGIAVKP